MNTTDYCPDCDEWTDHIEEKTDFGGNTLCRKCKKYSSSTNPTINPLNES